MEIELSNQDGITLKTKGKYCSEDIDITPKLQTKIITINGKVTSDNGYVGLKEVTVAVESEKPTLNAPTISLSNSTLTITNPATNGNFVTSYRIFNGSAELAVVTSTTVDLSTLLTEAGTHSITAKASAVNFNDSAESNAVGYVRYSINPTLTNVTAASGNATTIATGETKVLTYTANSGYTLPDSVTVTGATGVWNKDAGTLTLSNPTANVTFTIAGVEAASGYTVTFEGVTNSVLGNHDYALTYAYDGQDTNGTYTDITNGATVSCSSGYIYVEGYVYDSGLDSEPTVTGGVVVNSSGVTDYKAWILFKVTGNGTVSTISFNCFIEGTQITLADGTTKAVEDITYDDELLVWNFYAGRFDKAKPSWIKVEETAPRYNLVKFSNGSEVGFVGAGGEKGYHRIFNKEAGAFTHTGCIDTPNGTTTFAQDETFPTVVSQEVVEKEVKFYNVITDKHYNLFANGILTSCKLSNEYNIKDMKYVGEKLISGKEKDAYFEKIKKSITFKSTRK